MLLSDVVKTFPDARRITISPLQGYGDAANDGDISKTEWREEFLPPHHISKERPDGHPGKGKTSSRGEVEAATTATGPALPHSAGAGDAAAIPAMNDLDGA